MESYNDISMILTEVDFYKDDTQASQLLDWLKINDEAINKNIRENRATHKEIYAPFELLKEIFFNFTTNQLFHENENTFLNSITHFIEQAIPINLNIIKKNIPDILTPIKEYLEVIELLARYEYFQKSFSTFQKRFDDQVSEDLVKNAKAILAISHHFGKGGPFALQPGTLNRIFQILDSESQQLEIFNSTDLGKHFREECEYYVKQKAGVKEKVKSEDNAATREYESGGIIEYKINGVNQENLVNKHYQIYKKCECISEFIKNIKNSFADLHSNTALSYRMNGNNKAKQFYRNLKNDFIKYHHLIFEIHDLYQEQVQLTLSEEEQNTLNIKPTMSIFTVLEIKEALNLSEQRIELYKYEFFCMAIKFFQIYCMIDNIKSEMEEGKLNNQIDDYMDPNKLLTLLEHVELYYLRCNIHDEKNIEYDHWECKRYSEGNNKYLEFTHGICMRGKTFIKTIKTEKDRVTKLIAEKRLIDDKEKQAAALSAEKEARRLQEAAIKAQEAENELYEILEKEELKRKIIYEAKRNEYLQLDQSRKITLIGNLLSSKKEHVATSPSHNIYAFHAPKICYEPVVYYTDKQIDNLFSDFQKSSNKMDTIVTFRESASKEMSKVFAKIPKDFAYLCRCYATKAEAETISLCYATNKHNKMGINDCLNVLKKSMAQTINYCPKWEKQQQDYITQKYPEEHHALLFNELKKEIDHLLNWCEYTLDHTQTSLLNYEKLIERHQAKLSNEVQQLKRENKNSAAIRDWKREKNRKSNVIKQKRVSDIPYQCPYEKTRRENDIKIKQLDAQINTCSGAKKFATNLKNEFQSIKNQYDAEIVLFQTKLNTKLNIVENITMKKKHC